MRISKVITEAEIKIAVFDLGASKAPGPDRIQAFFYQQYWNIVGASICQMVKNIRNDPIKIRNINDPNQVLIPKIHKPECLKDFRPISLCNISYKVITKILSKRIRYILDKIIGKHQSSFIAGRQCSDNIIVTQEVIQPMKHKKGTRGWFAIKVDLEKVYDRLEWPFIHDTLRVVGLDENLCDIIMTCISSSSFRVLWDGTTSEEFKPSRGIR